jgi:cytochrome P450
MPGEVTAGATLTPDAHADAESPADAGPLIGSAPPSPAGPITEDELAGLPTPPEIEGTKLQHLLRFSQRQIEFVFGAQRRYGEVFRMKAVIPGEPTITSHPDHVRSLFTAKPELAPSLTGESPLRPIIGGDAVLTAVGPRHMRQRKLLLPPFHGEAIARYTEMISDAADREIASWQVGEPLALARPMQEITLDVIMAGIFGIEGEPEPGSSEHNLRKVIRWLTELSTTPLAKVGELMNSGRTEAVGPLKAAIGVLDRATYKVISERRAESDLSDRRDIMSIILQAETEDGELLTDEEVRGELLTLVLAGHETTANSLAWAWERLVHNPAALDTYVDAVRNGDEETRAAWTDAVIHESMRSRPVIPIIGRRVTVPWQLGEYGVPAGSPISMSILLLHHRPDIYPDPFSFRPERWLGHKPGTYEWIPFGGGIRRCLGAALAMAEQRVVLEAMARSLDLEHVNPEPERAQHRNVTMIPRDGGLVRITRRLG